MKPRHGTSNVNLPDYSALTNFLRGYLHQDAVVVHGTAIQAARNFRREADQRQAAIVRAELERLLEQTRSMPDSQLAALLEQLGSAWQFTSRAELEKLRDELK